MRGRGGAVLAAVVLGTAMVLGLLVAGRANAQEGQEPPPDPPPFDVQLSLSPEQVTLGDRVRLTITVTHSEDLLLTAEPPQRREAIELIETTPSVTTTLPDGRLRTEFGFTLAGFDLGLQQAGDVALSWLRADGVSGREELTPPAFEVRSALIGDGSDLRPLKPQLAFGDPPPAWVRPATFGGALAALVLAAGMGAWWWRRRRVATPQRVTAPVRVVEGPEAAARRALEELSMEGVLANGDYERYYGTLSIVVREYLEERFAFAATALTTPELEARMAGEGVDRWQARLAGGLLDRCDAAVYAGRSPDPASADHDLTVAFEIVEITRRPRAEAAGERTNGSAG